MQAASSRQAGTAEEALGVDVVDLSVVIVNYNVREFLEQALRSLQRAAGTLSVETFVVDNNSVDGSVAMVRSCFPGVRLIANETNVGFSRANNQAIRLARGRYLLILNPDTIVQEDTLETFVRFMEAHPEAGAVGCRILNPDGTFAPESRRAFPTPRVAFYRVSGLSRLFPRSRIFGRYNLTYLPQDEVAEVDALSGSCMLVRHAALYQAHADWEATGQPALRRPARVTGAGLFDEDFFMYGEDLDWCFRIQEAGWKIFYTPETQIIHYKGESTKKGELRYVRLFYGAMLRFTEKHFRSRYSRLFALFLRLGILLRAGLTVGANALRRATPLLLDALLAMLAVVAIGVVRSAAAEASTSALFLTTVPPLYALGTVIGIAMGGGYRHARRHRLRPVLAGALLGLVSIAAASFFIKDIAFSRVVVLLSFPAILTLLAGRRVLARTRDLNRPRRALLVGHAVEARRLQHMLSAHLQPPFELTGYVEDSRRCPEATPGAPPCLGTLRHLRDLVRLGRIDDVVFATDGLSNRTLFRLMQQLRDLPVQFRILAEGRTHLIGKASIDDLSLPALIEAPDALSTPRSPAARRLFELTVAVPGLLLHPALALAGRLAGPTSRPARLARRTRHLPAVLTGRRALIGCRPDEQGLLPTEWHLRPGLFAVSETLAAPNPSPQDRSRAYWSYVRNESAWLDWNVLLQALRNLK